MDKKTLRNKVIVIVFGLLFLGVGLYMLFTGNDKAKKCTVEAAGEVVDIEKRLNARTKDKSYNEQYTYYPVIAYMAGEERVRKQYNTGDDYYNKYTIGDKVTVLYNPDNVQEYIVKGDISSSFLGIIFTIIGGAVVVIGFVKNDFEVEFTTR